MDDSDPLAFLRNEFQLTEGRINMDGNSLGSLPKATISRLEDVVKREWGEGLIGSWSKAGWFEAPIRIGNKIAALIGADEGEVLVADTTSINLFKALCAAKQLNPDRSVILSSTENFPTDLYMMQGISAFTGGSVRTKVVEPEEVLGALNEEVAVLSLTQVDFKTARISDMKSITRQAHEKGILVVWDLSHSVGSIEVALNEAKVDFAVGCGYKFLNGGPGAPAFIFVAKRHQAATFPVLTGWMGHRDPFAFDLQYDPAPGIARFRSGTPGILGMAALEVGVDLFEKVSIADLRAKSQRLADLFTELMDRECAEFGFRLYSPAEHSLRAGHLAFGHEEAHGIYQAIKRRNVVSDFRMPDVLRFGLTPMYLRFIDVYDVVQIIKEVMVTRAWDRPEYKIRSAIT